MNAYQSTLYSALLALTQTQDDFSLRDFSLDDGRKLRVFNYRLGSYSAFKLPHALDCRGTMFLLDASDAPLALLSLPMQKFFGNEENPFTQNLDFSAGNLHYVANKLDGSLISTYVLDGVLKLKSKGSVVSREVAMATALLDSAPYAEMKKGLVVLEAMGYTVDLEYTGPDNRIVLDYPTERLSILSLRRREDGESLILDDIADDALKGALRAYEVEMLTPVPDDLFAVVADLEDHALFEGVVVGLKNGQRVKVKNPQYVLLHHAKDAVSFTEGITDLRKLYNCVVYERGDDLKSLFFDRPEVIGAIEALESQVIPKFNAMQAAVERFVEANRHLDKKSFAQLAQADNDGFFNLKMMQYLGKAVDYHGFALKNMGLFYQAKAA